jgi:hypothetical protein
VAGCVWPDAEWITGTGPFAVLARCHVLTVTLHQDQARAEASLRLIDDAGCGSRCSGNHRMVRLADDLAA